MSFTFDAINQLAAENLVSELPVWDDAFSPRSAMQYRVDLMDEDEEDEDEGSATLKEPQFDPEPIERGAVKHRFEHPFAQA